MKKKPFRIKVTLKGPDDETIAASTNNASAAEAIATLRLLYIFQGIEASKADKAAKEAYDGMVE